MKSLFTSNYARAGANPNALAISAKAPPWYQGKTFPLLAPTWDILHAYKRGEIDQDEYIRRYLLLLKKRKLTPDSVVEMLPDGAILLCYEKPSDFCHRRIVADWIELETDIKVNELLLEKEKPKRSIVDDLFQF